MSRLKRYFLDGNTYFITNVTYYRRPILIDNVTILQESFRRAAKKYKLILQGRVFLPDHFHLMINPGKFNLSEILHDIKMSFGGQYRSRHRIRDGRLWQNRFWDHIIRNQSDFNRHLDYIHYNPVKHGLVRKPLDYEYSSFKQYAEAGNYPDDWGCIGVMKFGGEYGE